MAKRLHLYWVAKSRKWHTTIATVVILLLIMKNSQGCICTSMSLTATETATAQLMNKKRYKGGGRRCGKGRGGKTPGKRMRLSCPSGKNALRDNIKTLRAFVILRSVLQYVIPFSDWCCRNCRWYAVATLYLKGTYVIDPGRHRLRKHSHNTCCDNTAAGADDVPRQCHQDTHRNKGAGLIARSRNITRME